MLVTTRLKKRWRDCSRAAWPAIVGGAKSASSVIRVAPTACLDCFRSPIVALTRAQALDRVVAPDRQRRHVRGDAVAERAVLVGGADADRDHRPQLELAGSSARGRAGSGRARPATAASTTSLTVPPAAFLIRFRSSRSVCDRGEAPVGADLDVERRGGRGEARAGEGAGGLERVDRRPGGAARGAERRPGRRARSRPGSSPARPAPRRASGRRWARAAASRARRRAAARGRGRRRRGPWLCQPRRRRRPGVVGLGDDREAAALDLSTSHISHSGFERSRRWEKTRAARIRSCSSRAGRGQGGVADVVVEVELRVVDPLRPALAVGDEAQLLAKAGHQVQARVDVLAKLVVLGRRALEHGRRGDVHVRRARARGAGTRSRGR